MLSNKLKRCLSFLMAMLMIVSLMPVSVLATDEETHDHSHEVVEQAAPETQEPVVTEEPNPVIEEFQYVIDDILDWYIGTSEVAAEEVPGLCASMDEMSLNEAAREIIGLAGDLEEALDAGLISESEGQALVDQNPAFMAFNDYVMSHATDVYNASVLAATGEYTPVTGVKVEVSGATDNSMSGGAITVTAKGKAGALGFIGGSTKTATITISNVSETTGTVYFNWTASDINQLKIDGKEYTEGSGNFEKQLNADSSFEVTITTAKNNTVNKLTMSDFDFVAAKESSDVTVVFDYGTVTVDNEKISTGDVFELNSTTGKIFTASSDKFIAWIDADSNTILSTSPTYECKPVDSITIKPVYNTGIRFTIGGLTVESGKLFEDLTDANNTATDGQVIVLYNNATLPAGDYTIKSGVTFMIPYDAQNTVLTNRPAECTTYAGRLEGTKADAYVNPSVHRTLTMADGASITVNGAISVGGGQCSAQAFNGLPMGTVGVINMASGSTITINNGAKLYAWGYIVGSGSVVIKSGGTVYEDFQLKDWRGGTAATNMLNNTEKVFPVSQYYIQNVEVPMTLEAGASEIGYISIVAGVAGYVGTYQGSEVPFVGSNAMFNITDGYVVKDYIESTDSLQVKIYGDVVMQSLQLEVAGTKMDSSQYVLPITNNMALCIEDGGNITVSQDMAFLPGSALIVEKGGFVNLADGINIFVYDVTSWNGKGLVYYQVDYAPLDYANLGNKAARSLTDAKIEIKGTIDANKGNIYTTSTNVMNVLGDEGGVLKVKGAAKNEDGTLVKKTYQAEQYGDNHKQIRYIEFSLNPVQMSNADGTAVSTNGLGATETTTFVYTAGKWVCETHTDTNPADGTCDVCGEVLCAHESTTTTTVEATCSSVGSITVTCDNCRVVISTETIPAASHNHTLTNTKPATCKEAGLKTYTCSGCGDTYTEEIKALGHKPGATATCITAQTCTVCGATLVEATGKHSYTVEVEGTKTPATCAATGSVTMKCATCTGTQVKTLEKEPSNHVKIVTAGAEAPTCQKTGLTAGEKCTSCSYTTQTVVAIVDHTDAANDGDHKCDFNCGTDNVTSHTGGTPTCTEKATCTECRQPYGETKPHSYNQNTVKEDALKSEANCASPAVYYKSCSCGDVDKSENAATFTDGEKDPTKHTGNTEVIGATAATCTADGYTGDTHCSDCDVKIKDGTTITAQGHNKTPHVKVDSTCTATGTIEYWSCDRCGKNYSDAACTTEVTDLTIPMKAHSFTEKSEQLVSAATCMAPAVYKAKCATCTLVSDTKVVEVGDPDTTNGHKFTGEIKNDGDGKTHSFLCVNGCENFGGAKDHEYGDWEVTKAATCAEAGSQQKTCACGHVVTEEIPMLEHDYNQEVADAKFLKSEARCTAKAVYYKSCTCGAKGTDTFEYGDPLGHKLTFVKGYAATCVKDGVLDHYNCSVCGKNFADENGVNILEDKDLVLPANPQNHDLESTVIKPTCTEQGYTLKKCKNCVHSYKENYVDPTGHTYTADWAWEKEKFTLTLTCNVCEEGTVDKTKIEKGTGSLDSEVSPECEKDGSVTYKANVTVDGKPYFDSNTVTIPATKHANKENKGQQDATCTEDGYTAGVYCPDCETWLSGHEVIKSEGHKYSEAVTKAATCTEDGVKTFTCKCGDTYTEAIAKLGHKGSDVTGQAATCTEPGWKQYYDCDNCDKIFSDAECKNEITNFEAWKIGDGKVDALDHALDGGVYHDPTFDADGYTLYTCTRKCGYTEKKIDENSKLVAVAKIGDQKFTSLEAAVAAAQYGAEIVLLANAVLTERLAIAAKVTVNLNGNNITANFTDDFGAIYVKVGAELTVKGEGVILNKADVAIANYGKVIIEGGTVKSDAADYNCGLYNMYYNGGVYGTAEIKGGTIESEVWNSGVLTVANGKLNGIDNSGALTITGGIVNGTIVAQDGSDAAELANRATIVISGGTFKNAVDKAWCAEGYGPNANTDGTYGVHAHVAGEATEEAGVASTCTVAGYKWSVVKCSACGEELERNKVELPLADHTPGTAVEEAGEASTCTVAGYKWSVINCSACGEELERNKVELPLADHTPGTAVEEAGVASTCTVAGYKWSVVKCSECGFEMSRTKVDLELAAHTAGEAVKENEKASTCTVAGSYESVVNCTVCGEELSRETKALELAAHTEGAVVVENNVAPSCTAKGSYDNVVYCTVCKGELSRNTVTVEKIAHTYKAEVTAPTCTAKGYTTYTCACGDSYTGNETEMVAHTPAAAVEENRVESTPTARGYYYSVVNCEDCGAEISREKVDLLLNPFNSSNMILDDSLALNFILNVSTLEGDDNYAIVTRTFSDDREDHVVRYDQKDWIVHNASKSLYKFRYSNIAAKEMTDEFYIVVYNSDGEQISVVREESVQAFGMRAVNSLMKTVQTKPEKLVDLKMYVDMLNYGAAAQVKFGYNQDNYANSLLTDEQQAYGTQNVSAENLQEKGVGYQTASLILETQIEMKMQFSKTVVNQDMYAIVTYSDHYGNSVERKIPGNEFINHSSSRWAVLVTGLAVPDGGQMITCRIYDANGTEVAYGIDSMYSYLARAIKGSTDQLYPATLKFMQSAHAYFHKNDN